MKWRGLLGAEGGDVVPLCSLSSVSSCSLLRFLLFELDFTSESLSLSELVSEDELLSSGLSSEALKVAATLVSKGDQNYC